jgi:hypothetical protein
MTDACGRNFLDILQQRTRFEIMERDDGFIQACDGRAWYFSQYPDHHVRNRRRSRMPGQIRLRTRHGKLVGPWQDYLFLSKKELGDILEGTAWKIRRTLACCGPQYVAILEKRH